LRTRRAVLGALAGLAGVPLARPVESAAVDLASMRSVTVKAYPFSAFSPRDDRQSGFGKLTFLSGLELQCPDPEFGGISSGVLEPDGLGFLLASDHAHWIKGRLVEQGGKLTGVERVEIAPMRAPDGRVMKKTRYFDTEGMARRGDEVFVSCERTHDILRFDLSRDLSARAQMTEVPAGIKRLDFNLGIEALGFLPRQSYKPGAMIALAERAPRPHAKGDMPGWILGPGGGELHVKRRDNFDLTDLNFLPSGDMLVLERRYVPLMGLSFRIRRFPIAQVKPGALLDGEVLIEADLSRQIDNMEAMMVHQDAQGRAILTLMSDDNFSFLQRTLVLRFAVSS
jgi:hypothetical protein